MKHLDQTLIQETAFEERLMGSHALVRAMASRGISVVIARHPFMLKSACNQRKNGRNPCIHHPESGAL